MKDIIKAVESLAKMAKEAGAALDSLLGREAEPMPQQPTAAVGSVPTPKTLPGEIGTGSPMAPVMPRTRQATWTGEGDTAAPATPTRKPASFWGQFTLGNVWESTKKEVVGIKRAYEAVTSAPAAVGNAVDSYVARSNALADVSVGDVVGKVREATKDIPPSDAWIGAQMGKLGEWLKTSLIKTSARVQQSSKSSATSSAMASVMRRIFASSVRGFWLLLLSHSLPMSCCMKRAVAISVSRFSWAFASRYCLRSYASPSS